MTGENDSEIYRHRLPEGYQVEGYRFEDVLGDGGFGITYLAHDLTHDRKVAIKEYIPNEIAVRNSGLSVQPKTESERENFEWGLERFVQEAEVLTRFDHPNIVHVHRFFRANDTGYMVMSYVEGRSLFDVMNYQGTLNERALKDILDPLLDGLETVHKAHFLHRDIKPENIYIGVDGQPVLLDFGAARQALGGRSRQVTTIVTPGFAPNEQYAADGNLGPWTDIYALAGVLYTGVTGEPPAEAPARANALLRGKRDPMVPAVEAGRGHFSVPFLEAIDHGLAVVEEQRPQTVPDWRTEFRTGARPQESLLLNVKAPVQTRVERLERAKGPDPSDTMVLPLSDAVGTSPAKTGHRETAPRPKEAHRAVPAPGSSVGVPYLATALLLAALGWGLYPLIVSGFPMPLGRFDMVTVVGALLAGLMVGAGMLAGRTGIGVAGVALVGAGWMAGMIGRFLSFEFVRLSGLQPTQSTSIAAGAVIGILGGLVIGWALRLSPSGLALWRWPLLIGAWGGLWAAKYNLYFIATQSLGRRVARQELTPDAMADWLRWVDVGLFAGVAALGMAITLWLAPAVHIVWRRGAAGRTAQTGLPATPAGRSPTPR